jgi:hypothetical protein
MEGPHKPLGQQMGGSKISITTGFRSLFFIAVSLHLCAATRPAAAVAASGALCIRARCYRETAEYLLQPLAPAFPAFQVKAPLLLRDGGLDIKTQPAFQTMIFVGRHIEFPPLKKLCREGLGRTLGLLTGLFIKFAPL